MTQDEIITKLKNRANTYFDQTKSNTIFYGDIILRLYEFKENPEDSKRCFNLMVVLDGLVMRIAFQLKKEYQFIPRDATQAELYNTAFLGVRKACIKFEIRDEKSLYSLPRFLRGYILREFKKEWDGPQRKWQMRNLRYIEEMRHTSDDAYNENKRHTRVLINELLRRARLDTVTECMIKMRLDGYTTHEIANVFFLDADSSVNDAVRKGLQKMRKTYEIINNWDGKLDAKSVLGLGLRGSVSPCAGSKI